MLSELVPSGCMPMLCVFFVFFNDNPGLTLILVRDCRFGVSSVNYPDPDQFYGRVKFVS